MLINQHITDPDVSVIGETFTNESLVFERTGSDYGRFLFTDWSPVLVSECVFIGEITPTPLQAMEFRDVVASQKTDHGIRYFTKSLR